MGTIFRSFLYAINNMIQWVSARSDLEDHHHNLHHIQLHRHENDNDDANDYDDDNDHDDDDDAINNTGCP